MDSSAETGSGHAGRLRQQEVLAELAQRALETDDLDRLLRDAADATASALDATHCAILEVGSDDEALLRQGVGWPDGVVGAATVEAGSETHAGAALRSAEPVVYDAAEDGVAGTDLLEREGVACGVGAAVGSEAEPWGVLAVYATEQRAFAEHEVAFVEHVAGVLGSAVPDHSAHGDVEEIYGRISDAFFALDEDWAFTYLNERAHELINPDDRTLLGERIWEAFPAATDRAFEEQYERAMYEQETVTFEEYYPEPLDTWFEVRAYPSETGLSVYFRDVTERKERERELRRTERRFEAVFEDPNILVGLLEPDGTVLDVNQTAMEYVDADLADVRGEAFWETPWWGGGDGADADGGPAASVQADVREWTERAADGEYVDFETDLVRPDGEQYTLSGYFRPVTDDDGEVVSIIVSDRDVTERREYERRLEESERRYRALVEHFPNGAVALVDENLEYQTVGGDPEATAKTSVEDIEGRPVASALPQKLADELVPRYEAAIADGEGGSFEMDLDGTIYQFQVVPVRDDDGEVFAALGMSQDVTERSERERELATYRTIVETVNDGIYVKDADGRFTMVNDAYAELTGYDRAELLGADASLVVDDATVEASEELLTAADEDGGPNPTMEATLHRADGETVPVEGTLSTFETDAGEELEVGVVRDVSDRIEQRRRIEESERRYRTLVEHFPNGAVALFDEDLEYTAIGGQLLDATGVDKADRLGHRVTEVLPEDVAEETATHFRAALDGDVREFEVELHGRHLHASVLPVRNAADDVFAGMAVVQDVTERREAQHELRESEARFRMLAENLEEVVWMASADAEQFVYVNPAVEDVWGLDRERIYEEPLAFLDVVHPEDHERVREAFAALPEREFDEEFRIEHPDGERCWIHARGAQVHDEDAGMVRTIGIGEDVTERKERERQLEESERRYRTLAENFPSGAVSVYDDDLRFTLAQGSLMGGVLPGRDAVEGRQPSEVYPPEIVEDLAPLLRAAVEDGESGSELFEFADRHWRVWATPLRDADGEIFAGLSFAQDVTEQVERERQLEELVEQLEASNERLEQFAYAASHDLQEPLRMVSSYLQLVERRYVDELDEDGREFIEYAVDGADRMREMIDALLEYSRVETEGQPLEPVDLDAVVDDVLSDLQLHVAETNADVTVGELPTVEGDPNQLRQLFQNLLDNALTYAGDEPPEVEVTAERTGRLWRVSVSDEGVGIDPAEQDAIFEVFQRLHSREEHAGTGIGLALCQRIVERHGGDIWVDSEPGEGSTFHFTLPPASDRDA